jgi:SAM-dependent methyltransferase
LFKIKRVTEGAMGMGIEAAQLILQEHRLRPLNGTLLMIGHPSTWFSPELAMQMIEAAGCRIRPGVSIELDTMTANAKAHPDRRWISDKSFFALFSDAEILTVDVSDYEGAELIHDMCRPLPTSMQGRFDFIFDRSSMDNIFDPVSAIRNFTLALKPDGRILHQNMGSPNAGPYLMFSAEWFFDYYLLNKFGDCRATLCCFDNDYHNEAFTQLIGWEPFIKDGDRWRAVTGQITARLPYELSNILVVVIAEKARRSTHDRVPIQFGYRFPVGGPGWRDISMRILRCAGRRAGGCRCRAIRRSDAISRSMKGSCILADARDRSIRARGANQVILNCALPSKMRGQRPLAPRSVSKRLRPNVRERRSGSPTC